MQIAAIKNKYNAEIALIILCCRHYLQTADNSPIQLFIHENKINWKQFYQISAAHRIRPIVFKALNPLKDVIKPENLQELRNYCIYLNAFSLNNKRELNRILSVLKQNNIIAKPFKGVAFAEIFFENTGMREFSDNDLIIQECDIVQLINIMITEGYRSKDIQFYKRFPNQYIRDYKDLLFEKWTGGVREFAFEFHFKTSRYFQGYSYTFEEVLGEGYITDIQHNDTNYLKLITLSNGLMDYYPNLRSILDIAVILKKQDYTKVYDSDSVLNDFILYGSMLSSALLNYPDISINHKNYSLKFYNYLLKNILELKSSERISLVKYMYYKITIANSIKYKAAQLIFFMLLLIRPNCNDVATIKLPYYFLYYFTKPFRIFIKIFKGKFT